MLNVNFYWVFFQERCLLSISTLDSSEVKNPSANAGDVGSILGSGKSSGEGNGNPLKYSCLGNPMDRGAWQTTVHESQSWTLLSDWTTAAAAYYYSDNMITLYDC